MKRFLSLLVAVVLVLSLSVVAFAEWEPASPDLFHDFFSYDDSSKIAKFNYSSSFLSSQPSASIDFLTSFEADSSSYLVAVPCRYSGPEWQYSFYFINVSGVSRLLKNGNRIQFSDAEGSLISVPALSLLYKPGGSFFGSVPSTLGFVDATYFVFLPGSYTSKSDFVKYLSSRGCVDENFSVSSFEFFVPSTPKFSLLIDYQYPDGTTAAPAHTSRIEPGKEYIAPSPAVVGHTPDQAVISGTMPEQDMHFTVTYSPTPYELSVNFVDDSGGQIARSAVQTVLYNESFAVSCPPVAGYTPEQETVSGIMPANDLSLSAAYTTNSYTLSVSYQNKDGTEAFPPVVQTVPFGDSYSITSPALEDYECDKPVVAGTMPSNDLGVIVTYMPPRPPLVVALDGSMEDFYSSVFSSVGSILLICICLLSIFSCIILLVRIIQRFCRW